MLKKFLCISILILSLLILPKTVFSSSTQPCYVNCQPQECHGHYCYTCLGCCCGGWPFSCDGYACEYSYTREYLCCWNDARCVPPGAPSCWSECRCDSSCGAPDPACDDKGTGSYWITDNTCNWCDSACYHYSTTCKCSKCKGNCTAGTTCYYNDACTSSGESYSSCSLCSSKKTGDCTSTGCQNYRCIKDSCGAECDSNDDCPPGPWEPDPNNICKERRALYSCDSSCNCVFDRYEYRDIPFDFSLSLSSLSGTVVKGGSTTTTATATIVSGCTQSVSFSCDSLPSGTTCSFSPASCNPTCSSTLNISTSSTTPVGTDIITVWGSGGGLMRGVGYHLTVRDCADITIDSSPQGSGFVSVDSLNITTPQTFCWQPGSTHTLSANSPVSIPGIPALRFIFSSWSDGGAQTHSITTPSSSTTYTASYNSQVYLAAQPNPSSGGTVSGSGWYNFGSIVTIQTTANTCYLFKNWTANWGGGYTGTANPATLNIDMRAFTFASSGNTPTQTANFDYNNGATCGVQHCSNLAVHSSGDDCTDITCKYKHYGICSSGNCIYNSEKCDNYDNSYCRCAVYSSKLREECRDYECVPLFGDTCAWTGDWIIKNEWTCDSTKENTKQTCNNTDYWCCYDNGYKWQTTPCGTCSHSLSINPDLESFTDTTKTWDISATDSSNSYCSSPITYSIFYSTSGDCAPGTGVSRNSFSINRGSTLTNAFNVTVKRSGSTCTLNLDVKDSNGNEVASGSYTVLAQAIPSCDNNQIDPGEDCDPSQPNSNQCPQTTTYCDLTNKKYCTRDSFGDCVNCQCQEDIWSCGAQEDVNYCSNCNHCGDGSCNCNEDSSNCPDDCVSFFEAWLGISDLSATLGQTFPVSVYVKNKGDNRDSYKFEVKTSSSNVQAKLYDSKISNVLPNSVASTKVEVKILALSSKEEVNVTVTSETYQTQSKELSVTVKIGSSNMDDLDIPSIVLLILISLTILTKDILSRG